ncbi:MAG: sigma 54-interacting transcriptional regulator, partial [Polyangiaceae bacterium]|nr:sigma 54-interacting transcriptional regulator [Polyangiaceae bacterium]
MGDHRTLGTTVPGASTHGTTGRSTPYGVIWVFPIPNTLTTPFVGTRILLGRGEACNVVLEGAEISRQHAELLRIGSEWVVHDLGSRNGVHVDAQRVEQSVLRVGSVLRLGEWVGIVRPFEAGPESGPSSFRQLAPGLYGGAQLQAAVMDAERAARSDVRIVIQGETGSGKARLAQAIHHWSGRTGEWVAANCAALSKDAMEGELFGYRKGALAGADRTYLGRFRAAQGGTLLLDEVTEMPLCVQPKLLRTLEERVIVPVGESVAVPVDVRVIAASQEPLQRAVEQQRLRADLCARLAGLTIAVPPLRERREDVPGLFAQLLQRHWDGPLPAVDPRLVECLCCHHWPYNVRELDQLTRYLAEARSQETVLRRAHLPKTMQYAEVHKQPASNGEAFDDGAVRQAVVRQELEKRLQRDKELESLRRALRLCRGNIT